MKYITKDGDRWDLIAYRLYGDPYVYDALLLYNPQYSHMPVLPAGIELTVPELEYEEDITEVAPPWQTD